jgi:hypothetical protein
MRGPDLRYDTTLVAPPAVSVPLRHPRTMTANIPRSAAKLQSNPATAQHRSLGPSSSRPAVMRPNMGAPTATVRVTVPRRCTACTELNSRPAASARLLACKLSGLPGRWQWRAVRHAVHRAQCRKCHWAKWTDVLAHCVRVPGFRRDSRWTRWMTVQYWRRRRRRLEDAVGQCPDCGADSRQGPGMRGRADLDSETESF